MAIYIGTVQFREVPLTALSQDCLVLPPPAPPPPGKRPALCCVTYILGLVAALLPPHPHSKVEVAAPPDIGPREDQTFTTKSNINAHLLAPNIESVKMSPVDCKSWSPG